MSRNSILLTLAVTALLSAPAHAVTPPQTGTGGERCTTCGSREERRSREKLLLQIDSLRWHIENKRMTEEERRRTVAELNTTIRALQRSLDASAGSVSVSVVTGEGVSTSTATIGSPVAVARIPMRARGYLGVTFDGPSAEISRPGEHAVRFYKYPRIALVEPSSPAERAGVLQGDTLMSFNGLDVVQNEISLTKLLVPDAKVVMRVRRDGNNKELKAIIAEAPDYYVLRRAPLAPARATAVAVGAEPVRAAAPAPPEPVQGYAVSWQDYEGVAGARVETVSEGLGKALGVDEGVLVVRVRPGTVAYRAGLRDGDVIIRAGDQRIGNVTMLRNVISMGEGGEGVKLLIKRERKEKDITLRW